MQRFQPPRTHEDRAMALCGMDDETALVFIKNKARKQGTEWLDSMLDLGIFDLADERMETHNGFMTPYRTADRIASLMGFLEETHLDTKSLTHDPEYGKLELPTTRMYIDASDAMKAFFVRYCDRLCDQLPILHANHPGNDGDGPFGGDGCDDEDFNRLNEALEKAVAHAIVGACALGLPDAAARFAREFPTALDIGLTADTVGFALSDFVYEKVEHLTLTPRCFAMQFSDRACMDALEKNAVGDTTTYAILRDTTPNNSNDPAQYDLLEAVGVLFAPVCEPSAFGKALAWRKGAHLGIRPETWTGQMEELLEGKGGFKASAPFYVAYEREGFFELFPTATAEMACKHGHAGILERLKGELDWEALAETQPLAMTHERSQALESPVKDQKDRYDDAMAAFCQRAIADDKNDYILIHTPSKKHPVMDAHYVQPMTFIVEGGFHKTLLKMLEAGMSPTEPPFPETVSPLDVAITHAKSPAFKGDASTEGLLRAYNARNAAHDLLEKIDMAP